MAFSFGEISEYFICEIISHDDPLESGRVKIKLTGRPDSESPISEFPWCLVLQNSSNISNAQTGQSPTLLIGSICIGFYLDKQKQQPIIIGSIFGKGDISDIASTVNQSEVYNQRKSNLEISETWQEPESQYNPRYPYNWTTSFSDGNFIEIDNSPEVERLAWSHKSGTFIEIHPSGDRVSKIVNDDYEIVIGNKYIKVKGNLEIQVEGNVNLIVNGDVTERIDGNKSTTIIGNSDEVVQGNKTISVTGSINMSSQTSITQLAPIIKLN